MDSLMAVELALGLEQRFGVKLPAMMLGDGMAVDRVAARLVEMFQKNFARFADHVDAEVRASGPVVMNTQAAE
jgi:acyl carrier protein